MNEVIYEKQINGLYCFHHEHLDLEWNCDYTERPNEVARTPTAVTISITATTREPDLDDIT